MRCAVVGHVEWVTFAVVPRLPAPGEILRASETFDEAAGGGGVAAVQISRLAGGCRFLTACREPATSRLGELGVTVHAADRPTRRAFTFLTDDAERTITVLDPRVVPLGSDPLPWDALAQCDAVFFTGGDEAAARAARTARVMVATPRAFEPLAAVEVDALVLSGNDPDELAWAQGLRARHRVFTDGPRGGRWEGGDDSGRWEAAPLPGPPVDAFGCGDTFAAALTFALGSGMGMDAALAFAARCGAACLTGRGPYGSSLPRP